MASRCVFWCKALRKELLIKLVVYFLIIPIGVIGRKMLTAEFDDDYVMELSYYIIPIFSVWGIMLFRGEVSIGKYREFMKGDLFTLKFSLLCLLFNEIIVCFLEKILLKSPKREFDRIFGLLVAIFFMSGLVTMLVEVSRSLSFTSAVVICYTIISSSPIVGIISGESNAIVRGVLLKELDRHYAFEPESFGFLLAGLFFWIVGTVSMFKRTEI